MKAAVLYQPGDPENFKIERNEIRPIIKKNFKLDEIVAAHQLMESNEGGGKIVVLT